MRVELRNGEVVDVLSPMEQNELAVIERQRPHPHWRFKFVDGVPVSARWYQPIDPVGLPIKETP